MFKKILVIGILAFIVLTFGACKNGDLPEEGTDLQLTNNAESVSKTPDGEDRENNGGKTDKNNGNGGEKSDGNSSSAVLIAYFSWSGNTKQFAEMIQEQIGGELFEIEPETPYTDDINKLSGISLQEQRDDIRPALGSTVEDMGQYDVVFIGFPNWWNNMPMPVFTFLEEYDFAGKTVIPFTTYGNGVWGKSIASIKDALPKSTVLDGLAIQEHKLQDASLEVSEWLQGLGFASGQTKGDAFVSAQYEIGDIILADGSIVKGTDLTILDGGNLPVAVIAGFGEDGTAFGLGVHKSSTTLQWAADDSAGYTTSFTETICTQESDSVFAGDKDGGDNWDAICARDGRDTADAAANYPAFHFANTYAESYGLSGDYALGWYMPSIAELYEIYQNRGAINDSLKRIYELDNHAAMSGLETNWYWSASQASVVEGYAWFVHYFNGYAGEGPKNATNVHVLAVRKF